MFYSQYCSGKDCAGRFRNDATRSGERINRQRAGSRETFRWLDHRLP